MALKRRIIKQGNDTLTVTLPREWTSNYSIKQGDELSLEVNGSSITLSVDRLFSMAKKSLDISHLTSVLPFVLLAFYRKGYDEISLTFDKEETLILIENILKNDTGGFHIVDSFRQSCTIKSLTEVSGVDFSEMLRKLFLLLKMKLEKINAYTESGNPMQLQTLVAMNSLPSRFTNFCHRLIAKKSVSSVESLPQLYLIINKLESLDSQLNLTINILLANSGCVGGGQSHNMLREIGALFADFYTSFYEKDTSSLVSVISRFNMMHERLGMISDNVSLPERMLLLNINNAMVHFHELLNAALLMKL